jgi:hypothetical protein
VGTVGPPLPYPDADVRAVTLLADGERLWLAVTAAVPIEPHDLDPGRVAGVDLGIIHPYAVVTQDAGLLVRGERSAPRATSTSRTSKPARSGQPGGRPRQGNAGPAAGGATAPACAAWRRAIAAADDPVWGGCRSLGVPDLTLGEDQATPPNRANVA